LTWNASIRLQADDAVEFAHRRLVFPGRGKRVAGREDVAGVQAHAEPVRRRDLVEDGGQVLEAMSQRTALPRRRLHQDANPEVRTADVHLVQRPRHTRQGRLLAAVQVRAGMHHQPVQAQFLGAVHLLDEGVE